MEGCGIEVCSIGPHERMDFRVNLDLAEQLDIAQRPIEFTPENREKVDGPFCVVVKTNAQGIGSSLLKTTALDKLDVPSLSSLASMNVFYPGRSRPENGYATNGRTSVAKRSTVSTASDMWLVRKLNTR